MTNKEFSAKLQNYIIFGEMKSMRIILLNSILLLFLLLNGCSTNRVTNEIPDNPHVISSGSVSNNVASYAFDNNLNTYWQSSYSESEVKNNAYIGYDFGENYNGQILQIELVQYRPITSIIIQTSSDGINWEYLMNWYLYTSPMLVMLPYLVNSRYIRILANSNPVNGSWCVSEIKMISKR